jgi:hypothetical protein
MIEHICGLRSQCRFVAFYRFDNGFNRFFAKLLGAFLRPFCEQLCCPALRATLGFARFDSLEQFVQNAHVNLTGIPAAAICAFA